MKRIKLLLSSLMVAFSMLVAPMALVATTYAQTTYNPGGAACSGANGGASNTTQDCTTNANANTLPNIVKNVINIFSWVVGAVSVIMLIWGGFKYITSGGDSGGVTAAKNTILYAIVGLVIVALSQVIVNFVLEKATTATNV
jgi:hypothetical protein